MKITRTKLLSIINLNSCQEFNDEIISLLHHSYMRSDDEKFDIPQTSLDKIPQCNKIQLELLNTIGIIIEDKWERNKDTYTSGRYYYIDRSMSKGFTLNSNTGTSINSNFTFNTLEEGENEENIIVTMMLMRSWVKYYNKIDRFVPDWRDGHQIKHGLKMNFNRFEIENLNNINAFVFGLSVGSRQRAEELSNEFEKDLLKIKW